MVGITEGNSSIPFFINAHLCLFHALANYEPQYSAFMLSDAGYKSFGVKFLVFRARFISGFIQPKSNFYIQLACESNVTVGFSTGASTGFSNSSFTAFFGIN